MRPVRLALAATLVALSALNAGFAVHPDGEPWGAMIVPSASVIDDFPWGGVTLPAAKVIDDYPWGSVIVSWGTDDYPWGP